MPMSINEQKMILENNKKKVENMYRLEIWFYENGNPGIPRHRVPIIYTGNIENFILTHCLDKRIFNEETIYTRTIGKKIILDPSGLARSQYLPEFKKLIYDINLWGEAEECINDELSSVEDASRSYNIKTHGWKYTAMYEGEIEIVAIQNNSLCLGFTCSITQEQQSITILATGNQADSNVEIISEGVALLSIPLKNLKETFDVLTMHECLDIIQHRFKKITDFSDFLKFCFDYNVLSKTETLFYDKDLDIKIEITTEIADLKNLELCNLLLSSTELMKYDNFKQMVVSIPLKEFAKTIGIGDNNNTLTTEVSLQVLDNLRQRYKSKNSYQDIIRFCQLNSIQLYNISDTVIYSSDYNDFMICSSCYDDATREIYADITDSTLIITQHMQFIRRSDNTGVDSTECAYIDFFPFKVAVGAKTHKEVIEILCNKFAMANCCGMILSFCKANGINYYGYLL